MQGMSGYDFEAILHKMPVFGEDGAPQDLVPAVALIIENGMTDVFHMYPDLVGAAGFEPAFNETYISQFLQYFVLSDSFNFHTDKIY